MSFKFLFVFCFFMVMNFVVKGQEVAPLFKHISTNDGLPSSTTYFVMQDSKGYMWIGTDHGVARYDGYDYKIFSTKDGLEDNTVFNLFEDTKGRIWILTFSGKIFFYKNDKIYPYKFNKVTADFVKGTVPLRIYVDELENVYLTAKGELKINSAGKATFENERNTKEFSNVLLHELDNSCILPSVVYSVKYGVPIHVFYKNNSSVDLIYTAPYSFSKIHALRFNRNDLIFAIYNSFYLYRNGSVTLLRKGPFTIIHYLLKDKNNMLYACTDKGLYIYNDIISSNSCEVYFKEKIVSSCCIDRENGFWVTTRDEGVYYLPDFAIKHFVNNDEKFEKPNCIISDFKSSVYAAYASGLITKISGSFEKAIYTSPPAKKVYNLFLDENKELVIGGDSSGYLNNNSFKPFVNPKIGANTYTHLKNNFIKHADGFLYSAAQSKLVRIANDSVAEVIECNQRINCLFETKQHQLLVGCINGALKFNDATGKTALYDSAFLNLSILDIREFNSHTCFATQGNGLVFFDGEKKISVTESNGLASDFVNKLLIRGNDIWCATNKGISHICVTDDKKFNYKISNITTSDGLVNNEINDIAFLNDTIWAATNSGISFFNSNHNFTNQVAPFVYLTSISINGNDTAIQENYLLSHDFNNLKISFRAISYRSANAIDYRYVLISNGDSIVGNTKNNEVEFLGLNAGKYSFRVLAQNSSGVWSKRASSLTFDIRPVWWQTWWFRIMIILLALLTGILFYRRHLKQLNRKFEAERSQAILQLTASRAQMNPHFIFNVMNSIRNYIQKSDVDSAQKYLTSFAKLIRYTLDNSEVQEISLNEELNALKIYAELEKQRFENAFEFNINCDNEIDLDETMVPSLLLQPYVENSIKHGIAKIETKGIISVSIKKFNDAILISIEDNGAGRPQKEISSLLEKETHKSHGTSISKNRIDAFNTAYGKNISAQTFDLKDKDQISTGTKVEILI